MVDPPYRGQPGLPPTTGHRIMAAEDSVLTLETVSDDDSITRVQVQLAFQACGHVSPNMTAAKVWPASVVLAHFLLYHKSTLAGRWIFEFGAGKAVPSLAAKLSGIVSSVFLQELPIDSLLAMQRSIFAANDLSTSPPSLVQVPMKWGQIPLQMPLELPTGKGKGIFVAADCLYDKDDFADFIATVAYFLDRCRGSPFVLCYQDRNLLYSIDELLDHWSLKSALIPLSSFKFEVGPFLAANSADLVEDFPEENTDTIMVLLEVRRHDEAFSFV